MQFIVNVSFNFKFLPKKTFCKHISTLIIVLHRIKNNIYTLRMQQIFTHNTFFMGQNKILINICYLIKQK